MAMAINIGTEIDPRSVFASAAPGNRLAPWLALYTNPRHEKRVKGQLQERGIHCFLPLYHSVHQWKDRRKQVDVPLFPGYVFVNLDSHDRLRVLQLPGAV